MFVFIFLSTIFLFSYVLKCVIRCYNSATTPAATAAYLHRDLDSLDQSPRRTRCDAVHPSNRQAGREPAR